MPVSRLDDLPVGGDGRWPFCGRGFRSAQWGDMEVGYTVTGAGDHTALYQGLPGGGDRRRSRRRCKYTGTDWPDEIASTGDAYFFRSGHVLIYEEETKALELNPAAALQTLMDHIESLARRHSGHEDRI